MLRSGSPIVVSVGQACLPFHAVELSARGDFVQFF